MSGFLRRSKSTRDTRSKARAQQEVPFTSSDLRLRNWQENTSGPYNDSLIKLARRKSISSTRESKTSLGLPETWNPPVTTTTITAEERKKRTSIFFGLAASPLRTAPAPPPPASAVPPKRAPPPPPIRLDAFPHPPRHGPSETESTETITATGQGEACVIGVALGSPNVGLALGSPGERQAAPVLFPSMDNIAAEKSPSFCLPATPFGLPPTEPANVEAERSRARNEEPPKTGGWKRMFGKGLFGRRNTVKSREPTPELIESRPPLPGTAKPRKLSKGSTHKEEKGEKQETKIDMSKIDMSNKPCLDVDIPCVEMERYSVMFNSLLQPSDKSTIYARRRSKQDLLNAFKNNDSQESVLGPQDAMIKLTGTSLSPSPSRTPEPGPRLQLNSLKRNATTGSHISPRSPLSRLGDDLRRISSESRRSRSRSPCRTPPPPSPGLSRSLSTSTAPPLSPFAATTHLSPPPRDTLPAASTPRRPSTASRISQISKISEESSIDTPRGSFDEGDDEWMTMAHSDDNVEWEMVTNGHPKSEEDLALAAQISIARQISVSQRQLLIPVVPKEQRLVSRGSIAKQVGMKPRLVQHKHSVSAVAKVE